ncbi:MAG: hypothetical protein ACRDI2_25535, partial [Chloroflexota bacterium]
FEETVAVFRESGRVAPVFSDKHLSWSWADAKWMYDTARELGIPFMAGSSLPLTDRQPPLQVELGAPVEEIVVTYNGPVESYGFHALEMAQCLAERRQGHETGVAAVQALRGEALWEAWERGDRWSRALQEAALGRVTRPDEAPRAYYQRRAAERRAPRPSAAAPTPARSRIEPADGRPPEPVEPCAFLVTYRDGLRVTALLLPDYVRGAGVAVQIDGQPEPLAMRLGGYRLEHFSKLVWHIEEMVRTGQPTYPVERTLLTTGVLEAAMTSRFQGGERVETPHLDVRYQPPSFGWQSVTPWPR